MVKVRGTSAGRWRIFRHDAGRPAGPPAWAYVLLYVATLLVGLWSTRTFGATVLWPANAVLLAAILQLHRRQAVGVLVACLAINLANNVVRGDPAFFAVANVVLNLAQVMVATVLARRYCGAALDMRRPQRLLRFALIGAAAVALSTLLAGLLAIANHRMPLGGLAFRLHHLFDMELLAMMIVTPSLLLLARRHRFRADAVARKGEALALIALVCATTVCVFSQTTAPILFMILPPLVLVAFRLSPPWTAAAVILIGLIGGYATLNGYGPVPLTVVTPDPALDGLPKIMRQMNVLHLFLLAVVVMALPITTASTERRRLTARLKAQTATALAARARAEQADLAKSRFLALMSHEMRTPLTGIAGYSDILSRAPGLDAETRRRIDAIRTSGDAMLRLVEDVLEVSHGCDDITVRPTDLMAVIEEAAAPSRALAMDRGLTFDVAIAPEAATHVLTDGRRLRQALHHIVANAVKFTSTGSIRIGVEHEDGVLHLSVTDTGCGMSAALCDRIFNLFEQVDASINRVHEGAGIGLALARAHVNRLGGVIEAESVEGSGSTFRLRLPAVAVAPPAEPETIELIDDVNEQALRVLIVDDHPTNRDLLRIMLQAAGCETQEACDGQEAIAAVTEQMFDIVLMDVRMPVVDGLAATRAIRALGDDRCDVAILAVTAEAMPEDAARCRAAGMDGHLAKPITSAKLYEAIEATLQSAAMRTAVAA